MQPVRHGSRQLKRRDGFKRHRIARARAAARPEHVERIAQIRAAGKKLVVLTNGASAPQAAALAKYHHWGFDFAPDEVIASRDLAAEALRAQAGVWAAIGPAGAPLDDPLPRTSPVVVPLRWLSESPSLVVTRLLSLQRAPVAIPAANTMPV